LVEDLPQELKSKIEKKKYVYHHSKETFDKIFIPWLIEDEKIENSLSEISSKYLLSSFSLFYISHINKLLKEKYRLSNIKSEDLVDMEKLENFKEEIIEIDNDKMIIWLKNEGLPELTETLNLIKIENRNDLSKIGKIEDLMIKALKQGEKNSKDEFYIYEILYQLIERLNEKGFLKSKIKKISVREVVREVSIETDSGTKFFKDEDSDLKLYWDIEKEVR
jgi:hypothetical protein